MQQESLLLVSGWLVENNYLDYNSRKDLTSNESPQSSCSENLLQQGIEVLREPLQIT